MKTLYLGLDPENYLRSHAQPLVHYPVIQTVPLYGPDYERAAWRNLDPSGPSKASYQFNCGKELAAPYRSGESPSVKEGVLQTALSFEPQFTHLLFTSQTAVRYWQRPLTGKIILAIGEATADAIRQRGAAPLLAPFATQEGMIALLETLDLQNAFLLLPRSRRARSALTDFLSKRRIRHFALDLYDTVFQKPEPVPDLNDFDEIVFTSPSTVEGFLRIYGALPKNKKLMPIGPVTERALQNVPQREEKPVVSQF